MALIPSYREEPPERPRAQGLQPTLATDRLLLRPFRLEDADDVRRLAGAREIAATTLNIPHPYGEGEAESWIRNLAAGWAAGREAVFALTDPRSPGLLLGATGLRLDLDHRRGELGYWIGVPHWGRGYATEAASAVRDFAFEILPVDRVTAFHMASNPASGRVLDKLGMRHEGVLRRHVVKWGRAQDLVIRAILREEWQALRRSR